jgi:hypothetical protein
MSKLHNRSASSEVKTTKARIKSASAATNRKKALNQLQMSYGGLGVHPSASKTFDNGYQSPSLNKSVSFS